MAIKTERRRDESRATKESRVVGKKGLRVRSLLLGAGALASLLTIGCATSPPTAATAPQAMDKTARSASPHGTASVAYAGSLQLVNDQTVGPAFVKATADGYQGRGGGSFGIAQLIASKEITPNVFESIGTGPVRILEPKFTRWAIGFASSPLVIAYSPTSPFAARMRAIALGREPLKDLFALLGAKDFHLGRTNPQTDPQGQAFIFMLRLAERVYHLQPGTANRIMGGIQNPQQIFAEEDILSRLQSGQLDASSAFLPEAIQRHLPYIALPPSIDLGSTAYQKTYATETLRLDSGKVVKGAPLEVYITSLTGSPDVASGLAFVHFVLSEQGARLYKASGFALTPKVVFGDRQAIPATLLPLLGR